MKPETVFAQRYRIVERLGQGGMATVYRVAQLSLHDRQRALKILDPVGHDANGAETLRLFQREVEILSRIECPNVVDIIDSGIETIGRRRRPWIVMPLLRGRDLDSLLEAHGAFSPSDTLRLMEQVAFALHAVHEAGVLHRDLKPSNLMVREPLHALQVTLIDFGIAKHLDGKVTRVSGTPYVAAPEQLRESVLDRQVDVWAFGLLAYELLTGEAYWQGESHQHLMMQVVGDEPVEPPTVRAASRGQKLPKAFDDWFTCTVNRKSSQRFLTIAAAMTALRRSLGPIWGPGRQPGPWQAVTPVHDSRSAIQKEERPVSAQRGDPKATRGPNNNLAKVGLRPYRTFTPAEVPAAPEFEALVSTEAARSRVNQVRTLLESSSRTRPELLEAHRRLAEAIDRGDRQEMIAALDLAREVEDRSWSAVRRDLRGVGEAIARVKLDVPHDLGIQGRNVRAQISAEAKRTLRLAPTISPSHLAVDTTWWSVLGTWVAASLEAWTWQVHATIGQCVADSCTRGAALCPGLEGAKVPRPELRHPSLGLPPSVLISDGESKSALEELLHEIDDRTASVVSERRGALSAWAIATLTTSEEAVAHWASRVYRSDLLEAVVRARGLLEPKA